MTQQPPTLSRSGWITVGWMLVASLQYGWHISALNQIQAALTCALPAPSSLPAFLPPCIHMNDFGFSVVTSSFTVGGLLGSIAANRAMESLGRKVSVRINAIFILLGSSFMSLAASVPPLVIGRALIGFGCGLGLCVVPVYLAETSPPSIKGGVGVLNQLSIVIGILLTQALGIVFAAPSLWRVVPLISGGLALAQLLLSARAVDSPAWLAATSRVPAAKAAATALWGDSTFLANGDSQDAHEEEGLLQRSEDNETPAADTSPRSPPTLLALLQPPLLRPLLTVCLAMVAQQISGINAVLYYSNAILASVIPGSAAYVSLSVTVVNALMTFPPIYLIDRIGRRALMTLSTLGSLVSLWVMGFSINNGYVVLASTAVLVFVASFAIGLGPVPFVIIPDVSPYYATSTLSSIALSLNWITNFIVGLAFLPLRRRLAGGDPSREGRIFYVFVGVLSVVYLAWARTYKGR